MKFLVNNFHLQTLFENFAFVLGMFAVLSLIHDGARNTPALPRKILLGLIFGIFSASFVLITYSYQDGIFLDARNVVVGMSGLFIGPIGVAVTAACAVIMCISMGGVGMVAGIIGVTLTALVSGSIHVALKKNEIRLTIPLLFLISFGLSTVGMFSFLALPPTQAIQMLSEIGGWYYMANMVWGVLLGLLLLQDQNRRELIENLAASERRAEEAYQAKSVFLAKMSHEIRTPLNGVMGFTDLLNKTRLDGTQYEYIQHVQTACRSLLSIVNDILDFSSIESGKMKIVLNGFSLKNAMEGCLAQIKPDADLKGLDLKLEFHGTYPEWVISDELRLRQVIMTLLNNACKFTQKGHIKIGVTSRKTSGHEWDINIIVSDSGAGIPPDDLERIFEAFEQGDNSHTRAAGGTGLGLSIAKNLTQILNGKISVESIPGKGSRFIISLPVQECAPLQENPAPHVRGSTALDKGRPKARILVAEDIPMNRIVLQAQLEQDGYDVTLAANGQEAVNILKEEKFDLVLMDVQMPVLNGIEATEKIRGELKLDHHALPVIAITAHALPDELKACLKAGMDDCLTKPITSETLYKKMNEWLGFAHSDHLAVNPAFQAEQNDREKIIDETQLAEFLRIVGGDKATIVYKEFAADVARRLENFQNNEPCTIEDLHALASMCGNLGMNRLHYFCRNRMELMKSQNSGLSENDTQLFKSYLNSSVSAFEQYLFKTRGLARDGGDCKIGDAQQ